MAIKKQDWAISKTRDFHRFSFEELLVCVSLMVAYCFYAILHFYFSIETIFVYLFP